MTTDPKLPACQRRCKELESEKSQLIEQRDMYFNSLQKASSNLDKYLEKNAQLLQQNKELREALEEIKTIYDNHQWDDDRGDLNSRIENMGTTSSETLSKHPKT